MILASSIFLCLDILRVLVAQVVLVTGGFFLCSQQEKAILLRYGNLWIQFFAGDSSTTINGQVDGVEYFISGLPFSDSVHAEVLIIDIDPLAVTIQPTNLF